MFLEKGLLGDAIRQARINANMTQEELAERVNITPTHLKHIESEHRKPSIEVLFQIATILNLSLYSLLFPADEDKADSIKKVHLLLSKCTDNELKIVYDVVSSLLQHREKID